MDSLGKAYGFQAKGPGGAGFGATAPDGGGGAWPDGRGLPGGGSPLRAWGRWEPGVFGGWSRQSIFLAARASQGGKLSHHASTGREIPRLGSEGIAGRALSLIWPHSCVWSGKMDFLALGGRAWPRPRDLEPEASGPSGRCFASAHGGLGEVGYRIVRFP